MFVTTRLSIFRMRRIYNKSPFFTSDNVKKFTTILIPSYLEDITPGIRNVISHYNTRTFSDTFPQIKIGFLNRSLGE